MAIFSALLDDVEFKTGVDLSRDRFTISKRFKHEGLSFLTITLPSLSDSLQSRLNGDEASPTDFQGFRLVRSGSFPRFLEGLFRLVLDVDSGSVRSDADVDAIISIRQICNLAKKIKIPCHESKVSKAIDNYIQIEQEVCSLNHSIDWDSHPISSFGREIWTSRLMRIDLDCYNNNLHPKHGPGSTSDRIRGNAKYRFKTWPSRLDDAFPLEEFAIANSSFWENAQSIKLLSPEQEIPSKVTAVPKTLKGPRLIAQEPVAMQYAQQSLLERFVDEIESMDIESIRFTDQSVNRRMALYSSINGDYATVDLKDASDRVPFNFVSSVFHRLPNLWKKMTACRSTKSILPNGDILHLGKWASQGSALCFPVLAVTVYTVAAYTVKQLTGLSTRRTIAYCNKNVFVYGDDLIIPTHILRDVIANLESIGLRVNKNKTYGGGYFRESCGMDAYRGYDVTPTRITRLPPTDVNSVDAIVSLVESSNSFHQKGYWRTASLIVDQINSLGVRLPLGSSCSGYLSLTTYQNVVEFDRYSADGLHNRIVKAFSVKSVIPSSKIDGHEALLKCLLHRGLDPLAKDHLDRAGRPASLRLKKRWTSSR